MPSCKVSCYAAVATSLCSVLGAVITAQPVQAASVGLAFDLPQSQPSPSQPASSQPAPTQPTTAATVEQAYTPLPIPANATEPPTRGPSAGKGNPRAYQTKAAPSDGLTAQLPPPPAGAVPQPRILSPQSSPSEQVEIAQAPSTEQAQTADAPPAQDIALGFPQAAVYSPATESTGTESTAAVPPAPINTDWIFEGGPDSLVARVVGSAEGTRTATGERTRHYNGHRDPGNGVWNLGTFSYQHGAASPEEADAKQLARLARQEKTLDNKAQRLGLELTLVERLNALDLANQSPAAALNQGGYIDRLYQAQQAGRSGNDAILWARTYSYMNPRTQRWNAPGLGNTYQSIRRDQNRRLQAIASALDAYQIQQAVATAEVTPPTRTSPQSAASTPVPESPEPQPKETAIAPPNPAVRGADSSTLTTDPLNFNLGDAASARQIPTPQTATPEMQLSTLQSSVSDPISSSQANRILNRVRSSTAAVQDN